MAFRIRRVAPFALALTGLLAVACSHESIEPQNSQGGSSPGDGASAGQVLLKSIGALQSTTYRITYNDGVLRETGVADPASHSAMATQQQTSIDGSTVTVETIMVSDRVWLRMDLGASANKHYGINPVGWMSIDKTRLADVRSLAIDVVGNDAFDLSGWLQGITEATRVDSTHIRGKVDFTQTGGVSCPHPASLANDGAAAKSVPFDVTLDGQGRLVNIKTNGAGIDPNLTAELSISQYGSPVSVGPPGGQPAPARLYTLLNG
jgi:hypothetical protein